MFVILIAKTTLKYKVFIKVDYIQGHTCQLIMIEIIVLLLI